MIPIKLSLTNFMSYGEEKSVLDLRGVQVACLSGDNGNGKSAILDAITYVLWGKTRASGSAASGDNDLIRLGADDMEVGLEFKLGAEIYRVIRKRNRKANSGDWHVHLSDGNGSWLPVGGTGMRETEKNLVRILRMEHETFLNSAYFQQGRADEFTRQKPEARKRILGDILDLKRYDRLSEFAKRHRDECATAIAELDGEIRVLESRIGDEPALAAQLVEQEVELKERHTSRETNLERLKVLQDKLAAAEEKSRRLADAEARLKDDHSAIAVLEEDLSRLRDRQSSLAEILQERKSIATEFELLGKTRAQVSELEGRVQELYRVRQEQTALERCLDQLRFELTQKISRGESELRIAEQFAREADVLKLKIVEAGRTLQKMASCEVDLDNARSDREAASNAFMELKAENEQLESDIREQCDILEILSRPGAQCPVCESDLHGGKRDNVIARAQNKKEASSARQIQIKREGAERKKQKEELEKRILAIEMEVREFAGLRAQVSEWSVRMEETISHSKGRKELVASLTILQQKLAGNDFGREERAALGQINGKIAQLEAFERELAQVRLAIKKLEERGIEARFAQLGEAEKGAAQLAKEIVDRESSLNSRTRAVSEEARHLESLRTELAEYPGLRQETGAAEQSHRHSNAAWEQQQVAVARTRQALDDCVAAKAHREKKLADRSIAAKEKQSYTELAAAFGRSGVQALIIHNVLPEIEDEANRLLARMTDNAMHVTLDTQRAAKTGGGQIETLDISITDDAGTRPYEMFSGGEAFRVNFAIRIALSRLLARRAGARLQTLIIDEGFGTQDAKGRDRLVEAIQSVQDEFALILVITHMDDLKDSFPTRIDVIKGPNGSRISLAD